MFKDIIRLISRIRLVIVYSFLILLVLILYLSFTAFVAYLLIKLGFFKQNSLETPLIMFEYLGTLSIILGVLFVTIVTKLTFKPIHKVFKAMEELSNGNFNVRYNVKGLMRGTELMDFSDAFNRMAEELGSIEMLRSDFVNNFSHEFKTPIVSLRGFAKLLKEKNLTQEEREEYLDIIIQESDRLTALATNILNLSKIETQTIITKFENYNLSEQIRRVILMMECKWVKKELELEIELDEVQFYGNFDLLNQVIVNVLDNAIKFSPNDGEIQINLTEFPNYIEFKVQDYGCGMDQETQSRIFNKFYQGDTSHQSEGNGIGMTVVNKIVLLHHGAIKIDSALGKGTLVIITLPKRIEKGGNKT